MPPTIRVLIADDHPVIRQGLSVLLGTEPDLEIVGEADDGRKAVELAVKSKPHIVLMDVMMPFLNGAAATRRILQLQPECKVLALSTYTDDDAVRRMLEAGAVGYLTKQSAADELIKAIRQALSGITYFSRSVAPTVQRVRDAELNNSDPNKGVNELEKHVIKLIAEGLTNKEIATRLQLSLSQMKYCRERVMDKLNARNIAELTRFALAKGWVTLLNQKPAINGEPSKQPSYACPSVAQAPAALPDNPPAPPVRNRLAA